jgi:hypothetical protein
MKHAKTAAVTGADIVATPDADKLFIQDGAVTISGFDAAHDRLLFVGNSYSDILYFGDIHDGLSFDTFVGSHFEVHAGDFNGDGLIDTQIVGSDSIVTLLSVDPASLHPWNLMGG